MAEINSNQWQLFMGVAVEDKKPNSRLVKVHVMELTPYISGELNDLTGKEKIKIINEDKDGEETIEIDSTNSIVCEYFGLCTNRFFPPDLIKGEQVLVIKYGDEDKYRWFPLGRDDNLRKKEILRFAVSNSNEITKDLDDSNTYFIELDTLHNKRIRLCTSKSDGEKFKYTIIIDAKKSFASITDDIGNIIIMESEKPRIKLKNSDGTIVDLNTKNIFMQANEDISIRAGNLLTFKSKNELHLTEEVYQSDANKTTINSLGGLSIVSPVTEISGALKAGVSIETLVMIASLYNIGIMTPITPPSTIDYEKGISKDNTLISAVPNEGTGLRYSAAQLEVTQALTIIQACLTVINSHITLPAEHTTLAALGLQSLMPMNKGT